MNPPTRLADFMPPKDKLIFTDPQPYNWPAVTLSVIVGLLLAALVLMMDRLDMLPTVMLKGVK